MSNLTDMSFLSNFTGGDKEKIAKYIGMFLNAAPDHIEKMKSNIESQNYEDVKIAAHSLKPQLGYMGIKSLEETIIAIENYAGNNTNIDQLPGLIAHVEQVCDEAFIELKALI